MKDVFIALLNMSISATWLIAAVVLVRLCMGKAPKWIRGVLWAMVALRLVVPFALESPISLVPDLQISVDAPTEQASPVADATEGVPATEQVYTPPVVNMPVVNTPVVTPDLPPVSEPATDKPIINEPIIDEPPVSEPVVDTPVINEPDVDEPIVDAPVITPDEAPEAEPVMVADEKKGVDIAFIVAVIWCIGTLVMAVYCVGSYWRLKLKLREAVRVGEGVYESEWIKSAFVLGIIKPYHLYPLRSTRGRP